MKIRQGFVSNSSSASFIVEVKGKHKDIFAALYSNLECFQEEACKKLLERDLERENKKIEEDKFKSEGEKSAAEWTIKDIEKDLDHLEKYKAPDWYTDRKKPEKEQQLSKFRHGRHIDKVVRNIINRRHIEVRTTDDGYVKFEEWTLQYNGWENIEMRKELIELLAFFTFMKYDVKTRIENHEGAW